MVWVGGKALGTSFSIRQRTGDLDHHINVNA